MFPLQPQQRILSLPPLLKVMILHHSSEQCTRSSRYREIAAIVLSCGELDIGVHLGSNLD